MKKLIKNFKLLSVLFLAISFIGCDDDEVVLPEVLAGFTYTVNQDTGTVIFINISENADTYEWDFGDGTSSKQINPIKSYATGEYTVVLKAKNIAGASGTFEDQVYINIPVPVRLPISFDGKNVKYNAVGVFNGVAFNVVDNPDVSGSNAVASKVGAITNSGAAYEGFYYDLDASVNLTTDKTIKMNLWSDKVLDVLVKLEEGTAAATELNVSHGGTGWEELIFTFDSSASYNRFTMFVDGPGTTAGTFYIDDIEQVPTIDITAPVITLNGDTMMTVNLGGVFTDPGATATDNMDGNISANIVVAGDAVDVNAAGSYVITYNVSDAAGNAAVEITRTVEVVACTNTMLELPIDFDCSGIDYATKIVGNVSFTVIDNPQLSGVNNVASKVGQITNVGVNWENAFFNLDTPVDFSTDKGIKMKFYSIQALTLKLKFEDGTAAPIENDQNHGGTGWEELTFTLNSSDSYNDMVLFVDGPGTTAGTFYIDDVEQVAVTPPPAACTDTMLELPIDFDCASIDYESKRVPGDIGFSIIDNPQVNGVNAVATKVGEIVNIGNNWENLNFTLDTPMNFATDKSIKLKLYSTQSVDIKLKVENGGAPVENDQTHGGTGWEELTFTLGTSESFSNIIVFIDGPGNTAGTFYIDDIEQVAAGGGGGGTGTGAYLYSTEGTVDIVTVWSDWGTGTVQDGAYDQDATYNPCIKLSGTGSWGTVVAFTEIPTGKMAEYGNLEFKIKSSDSWIKVKVPEVEKEFTIADGTPLEGGWTQMSIPLSTFGDAAVDAAKEFAIFGSGGATLYLTDVMLSGEGSGGTGGGGDCPAPPAGELLSNGDFEAGDVGCWQFFAGTSISTTVNNGGTKSAEMQGATGAAVGLKQERFAAGVLLPNTSYTVSFDIIADGPFGEGGVFKAFTFSEGVDGGSVGATQHILADGVTSLSTTWETKTYEFTTAPNANQVEGGLSFYMEIVNSAVKLNVDNVVIKIK